MRTAKDLFGITPLKCNKLIVLKLFLVYLLIMPGEWKSEVKCNTKISLFKGVPSSPRLI